jgi:hypothetical protein
MRAQLGRTPFGYDGAAVQQRQPVAAAGLFQNVGGEQDRHAFVVAQALDVAREVAARGRVEPRGGLVHQQHLRPVKQGLGDFHAPPQAARKRFHNVLAAVGEAQALGGALHPGAQIGALQPVQMALGAQVLLHRQRSIEALALEHHAHAAAHARGVANHVAPGYRGAAPGGDHHGGEYPEQGGLAAAIRSQQAEDFALLHFEADVRERQPVTIAVRQIFNLNHKPGLSRSRSP